MLNNLKQKLYKLLRLSEKWTGTDMIYLAKGGFWLTFSKSIGIVISIFLATAYAKLLPKEDYGLYKYILSLVSLLSITTLSGLNDSLVRGVARGSEGIVNKVVKTKFKFGLLGILCGLVVSAYYFFHGNTIMSFAFLFAGILSPMNDSLFVYGSYLSGKKLFQTIAIYNILYQVFMALFIILVLIFASDMIYLLLAYYLGSFTLNFVFNYSTYKKYPPNDQLDDETIPLGKHVSVINILGILASQADKTLMWHFFGPVQLAIYSYAVLPIDSFESYVAKSISPLALPKLSTQKKEVIKTTLPSKISKFSGLLILPAIIYYFISPYLFKYLFPEYLDSVKYTQIYAFALILFPSRLFSTTLFALAQKKSLYISSIITPIFKISTMIIFIYFWGIGGAILSLLTNLLLGFCVNYYYFKKM